MPTYNFQCSCGVRFEAVAPIKDHQKPRKCPDCGELAPRHVPDNVSGVFNQPVTGPVPQNTGLSQLDAHIDRVIGQSAKQGWDVHGKRKQVKEEVLQAVPGKRPEDLSLNPDGSYRVMAPEERGVHERANTINSLAMTTLKGKKKRA